MKISRRDAMKLFAGSVPAYYANQALVSAAESAADTPKIGLKDAYKGKFLIGTAGDLPSGYNETELANIKANYDIVTPENCMKPQPTQPQEGSFNFQRPDALVEWAAQNGLKVWGHTLCWHSQSPQFFFQGTKEEGLTKLQKHIETVAGHMAGKVIGWDVVNESISDTANEQSENLRNSSWYSLVGPQVLNKAFEWAHKADPDAKLYYNDYSIEQHAADNRGKHPSSMLLLKRLLDEGAPINGVGIQGHWHLDSRVDNIEKAIENYKSLGLEIAVTELDVTTRGFNSGAFNPGPDAAMAPSRNATFSLAGFEGAAPGGAPGGAAGGARRGAGGQGGAGARRGRGGAGGGMFGGGMMGGRGGGAPVDPEELAKMFEQQAEMYTKMFKIFMNNKDVVKRVTFWGISDTRTWRRGQNPLLFDGDLKPKPAFDAVINVGLGKS
ncbi:MAG: endo-1,4-beta-xylanase [Sedimentisphaerales bacterium]|nr:endo-1,4-beta-xylanase [Sedimentisphaerales bacterium]